MTGAHKQSKPTFFWQGVLILLPVALMAGFGLWAIWREHKAVEQDARQRAREILDSLPYNFAGRVAFRMGYLATMSAKWSMLPEKRADLEAQEGEVAEEWGAAGNLISHEETNQLHTSLPGKVWPINFLLDANGDFWDSTYHEAPQPPAWFAAMTGEQRQAWAALRQADFDQTSPLNVSNLVADLLKTEPPAPARECAQFIRLRAEQFSEPDAEAQSALLTFGKNCSDAETDSGLPVSNLVMAEALRRSQGGRLTDALRDQLQFEVRHRPSLLTPRLLDEAEQLAGGDKAGAESLKNMRALWEARQTQRALAEQVKQTGNVNGFDTVTNFWIQAMDERWFCVVQPKEVFTARAVSNQPVVLRTNIWTEVIPYPESFLAKSFSESLHEAGISLPDYFGMSTELEGEQITLPTAWSLLWVLAERQIALSLPSSSDNFFDAKAEAMQFDSMPTHPRLTLRIFLADPKLLYARQRQREIMFGSLIGLSAFAAMAGFVAARRAFVRQTQLNEMKSNFVSSVSHELRAPIASVRLMAESLERGKISGPEKQNEYFRFIVQECRRLSSLIENVLDFSRIEQGHKQYEFEPTDLVALTRQTVKLMQAYADERHIPLTHAVSGDPAPVEADGKAMQQALVNLLDNAIKHSPNGSPVQVGLEFNGGSARLSVEDKGEGIAPEEHEKIFERFYRLGSELRRETQGVGIGLSLVKHIVEAHGGRVHIKSEVSKGSSFTIELPIETAETQRRGENKK